MDLPRITGVLLILAGVAHLAVPTRLLDIAARVYHAVLKVEFDPLPEASNRVQVLGVGLIAAGAHLLYYGGLLPSSE
ncbi:hypothetical protein GRX03_12395 [Halovenus sp. WSH3]|uniref:Uncharacterized protein n=1 Tax=Halovenus carboxidivorans TaxID=2692199 RepID=A0A6B0TBX3_9EURY|nr:hypothetical protein [Halovenus carboxidivorans]